MTRIIHNYKNYHEMMKFLLVDNYLADVSIKCSNPPQAEMKLDWRDSALYRFLGGKLIGSIVSGHAWSYICVGVSSAGVAQAGPTL